MARLPGSAQGRHIIGSIHTERLELIPVGLEIAETELTDRALFAAMLDARVPESWPPETLADALQVFCDLLREDPSCTGWIGWYAILVTEGERVLVGSVGFTGPPDANGRLETGYSMVPEYYGRGFATEMVRALCAWAFAQPGVTKIVANANRSNAASMRVLEKSGFTRVAAAAEVEAGVEATPGPPEAPDALVHYERYRAPTSR